jgi:putative transcriptional regulator
VYRPIEIDREKLTIMGVKFPDRATLESTASALGSNMFEGFEPTARYVLLIRDYVTGKVDFIQFVEAAKIAAHA